MVGHKNLKAGTLVWEFAVPGIGHLLAAGGSEFVFLDTEHSGLGIDTLKSTLQYLKAASIPALVRPPARSYESIARALDAGSEGLILPMVASGDEARRIVQCAKYAPMGARGVALGIAHDDYTSGPIAEKLAAANRRTVLFALVETREGAETVDALASGDGIDGLWIGHLDLSSSLGIPGQFDHPDYVRAVDRIAKAASDHGKSLGRMVEGAEEGAKLYAHGFDFIAIGTDTQLYVNALRSELAALRGGCE
jgi:2-dehydro-3-deoxyglucarate aldolase/4-hydroxy-2-oxoheptanedioate aldolase